ncbi:hypothetical protein BJL95_20100 [Methylomonas sp. LWB]|nr:hypothetical protein BJL95_20100 [Methylomonas sp. LWB]
MIPNLAAYIASGIQRSLPRMQTTYADRAVTSKFGARDFGQQTLWLFIEQNFNAALQKDHTTLQCQLKAFNP